MKARHVHGEPFGPGVGAQPVPVPGPLGLGEPLGRVQVVPGPVGGGHGDQSGHPLRGQHRGRVHGAGAPVVAGQHHPVQPEAVQQVQQVGGERGDLGAARVGPGVRVDPAAAVAAQVGPDDAEAGGQPRHDLLPGGGDVGEAVHQHHRPPVRVAVLEVLQLGDRGLDQRHPPTIDSRARPVRGGPCCRSVSAGRSGPVDLGRSIWAGRSGPVDLGRSIWAGRSGWSIWPVRRSPVAGGPGQFRHEVSAVDRAHAGWRGRTALGAGALHRVQLPVLGERDGRVAGGDVHDAGGRARPTAGTGPG